MSKKSGRGLLKTEHIHSNIHQPCSSRVDPIQYLHMCKRNLIHQIKKGWNLTIPQTKHLFGKCLKPHRKPRLPPPLLLVEEGWRKKSGRKWLYPSSSCLELRGYGWPTLSPNFDAREWNEKRKEKEKNSYKCHILESEATLSEAASKSCGTDRRFFLFLFFCF